MGGTKYSDHSFVDNLGTVSDVGIVDGIGCYTLTVYRAYRTDGSKGIRTTDADNAESTSGGSGQCADSIFRIDDRQLEKDS